MIVQRWLSASVPVWACLVITVLLIVGCGQQPVPAPVAGAAATGPAPVLISVVSDMDSNPQAVDMALKLAGFSLDEGRDVFLFFNVKGVRVPLATLTDDVVWSSGPPIREQLAGLIERGATIHACPICMKALDVTADQLFEGVQVTDRAALFARISPTTCVFTY